MSFKKFFKKVVKTIKKIVRTAKESSNRIMGTFDFLGSLAGIRPRKYLRVKVVVLSDGKGPIVPISPTVEAWWDEARRVFLNRANVKINTFNSPLQGSAPIMSILVGNRSDVFAVSECSFGATFSDVSDFFEDTALEIKGGFQQTPLAGWVADNVGIGESIVAFVIRDIGGTAVGCSYPFVNFHALVAGAPAPPKKTKTTTLAHELGHMCGLWHTSGQTNLMNSDRGDLDSDLSRLQISVLRNSRFVTYIERTA